MAVGNATITTGIKFLPQWWAEKIQIAQEFSRNFIKRINTDYGGGDIKSSGDTVEIMHLSNLTDKVKAVDTDVAFEAITETGQSLLVNQYRYAAFLVEDALDIQALPDLASLYQKKIAYALSRTQETFMTKLVSSLADVVGTLLVELTVDDYARAWQYLADAGIIDDGNLESDFSIFLSPASAGAAMKIDEFTRTDYKGEGFGPVGKILNIPVFVSNLLGGTAAAGHHNCMMHRDAFAFVEQKTQVKSDYILEKVGFGVVGFSVYGGAELARPPEDAGGGTMEDDRGVYLKSL